MLPRSGDFRVFFDSASREILKTLVVCQKEQFKIFLAGFLVAELPQKELFQYTRIH